MLAATAAFANPVGGTVSAGSASISSSGTTLDITQTTDKAVIDWRSFNIAAGETTKFIQPSSSSIMLNRIGGGNPSQIFGHLSANGEIILLNPSGVLFGPGSQVDVNGLLATTAGISNQAFMAKGPLNFNQPGNPTASIINNGSITAAQAGLVGLVAPNVINNGLITVRLGKVQLSSADTFVMDLYGDGLMSFAVSPAVQKQLVENEGTISAAGGTIALTAAAGNSVVNSLIKADGELNAPAVAQKNGKIMIYAAGSNAVAGNVAANKGKLSGSSTVLVGGKLDASGTAKGQTGGSISVLGDNVGLMSGASLNVNGDGAGSVQVGGDFHGAGTTPTALNTYVDPNAAIYANAVTSGNGGNVAVWSDGTTNFLGSIAAEGGAQSGNGGFVETSGHNYLNFNGTVNTTAASGTTGTLLLDPTDITITTSNSTNMVNTAGTFADTVDQPANLSAATLDAALNTSNITVSTTSGLAGTGVITVSSAIAWSSIYSLTLSAANNIAINSTITNSSTGGFTATSGLTTTSGGIATGVGDAISLAGGALTFNPGSTSTSTIAGNLATAGGLITINNPGAATVSGIISGTATGVTKTGAGTLTLSGINTFTGGLTIDNGTVVGTTSVNAFGANASIIHLGDGLSDGNTATLEFGGVTSGLTFANPISLVSGTTGALTIGSTGTAISGTFSGGVTSTGTNTNLLINPNSTSGTIAFTTAAVNNAGTVTDIGSGTGVGTVTIGATGGIGANVTGVTEDSTTSALTISGPVAINSGGTTLTNTLGTTVLTVSDGITGSGNLILQNNSNKAGGITLTTVAINNIGTITNSGTGGAALTGTVTITAPVGGNVTAITENSGGSTLALSGSVTVGSTNLILTNNNASGTAQLTSSASITGTGNLALYNNSSVGTTMATSGILISGTTVSNSGAAGIINEGSGSGSTGIGAIIGTGVTGGVVENSASSTLFLGGANTFTSGLTINNGTVAGTVANAFGASVANGVGTGTVHMGDGTNDGNTATLLLDGAVTFPNPISLVSGTTGNLTIGSMGAALSGGFSGGVTSTSTNTNLIINANSTTGTLAFSVAAINNSGTVTDASAGSGLVTIGATGGIGSNVTALYENSTTSALTVSGSTAVNSGGTTLIDALGAKALTLSGGVTGTGSLILDNNSSTAANITLTTVAVNNVGTITNSGTGGTGAGTVTITAPVGGNVTGITENSTGSTLALSGSVTVGSTNLILTNNNVSGSAQLTSSATITGTGNLALYNNSSIGTTMATSGILISGTTVSNSGAAGIINEGSGSGSTGIGAIIGTGVTGGVTENSSSSPLILTGTNTYTSATTLTAGTIEVGGNNALGANTAIFNLNGGTIESSSATAYTLANPITLGGSSTIAGAGALTFNGIIAGGAGASLTDNTTATLTLGGANTFTGGLNIYAGTVAATNANGFGGSGTGTVTLGNSSGSVAATMEGDTNTTGTIYDNPIVLGGCTTCTLTLANIIAKTATFGSGTAGISGTGNLNINNNSTTLVTIAGEVNNTGMVTFSGTSTGGVTLNNATAAIGPNVTSVTQSSAGSPTIISTASTDTGTTTLTAGILEIGNAAALGTSTLVLNGGTFQSSSATGYTLANNPITLGGNTIIGGTGALTFSGALTNTGSFTITNSDSGAGGVTLGAAALSNNSTANTLTITGADNTTISGVISDGGTSTGDSITKAGAGTLTFSNSINTYTGVTTITAGILAVGSVAVEGAGGGTASGLGAAGNAASNLVLGGGTLKYTSATSGSTDRAFTLSNATTSTIDVLTAGVTLTMSGASAATSGNLTVANGTATSGLYFTGANAYTGNTTLTLGILDMGNASALGDGTGTISLNGGTLEADATGYTLVNSITLAASSTIGNGGGTLTFTNTLTNTGAFTVTDNDAALVTLGAVALSNSAANNILSITNAGPVTINGVISNGGSATTAALSKAGAGTLYLTGSSSNTYGGTTTMSAGTLEIGNTSAAPIGNGTGTLSLSGGTIVGDGLNAYTFTNPVTLNGTNTIGNPASGSSPLTFSGAIAMTAGAVNLVVSNAGGTTFGTSLSPSTLTNTHTLTVSGTGNLTINDAIWGATTSSITENQTGTGTLTLAGSNTYAGTSGTTTLSAGVLRVTNPSGLGASALSLGGGTLQLASDTSSTFGFGGVGNNTTITGSTTIVSDVITPGGAGVTETLGTLSQPNKTLLINVGGNVGSGTAGITFAGTTFTNSPTFTVSSGAELTLGALSDGATSTVRAITSNGLGTLNFNAAATTWGTLATDTLAISNGTVLLSSSSVFGATPANGGTLVDPTTITITAGATLAIGANSNTVGAVTDSSTTGGGITGTTGILTSSGYTLSNASGIVTVSAILACGSGTCMTKNGAGTDILSGANTYTGGTALSAGVLRVTNANGLGAGALTMSGGTLQLAADAGSTFGNNTTITGSSTVVTDVVTPGGSGVTQTLGTLSQGTFTLTVNPGANVTGGAPGVTSGATPITGSPATFTVASGTELTLGALSDNSAVHSITSNGAGTLAFSSTASSWATAADALTVSNGAVLLGSSSVFGTGTNTNVNISALAGDTATLNLNGNSQSIGTLTFTGGNTASTSNVSLGESTLTLGGNVTHTSVNQNGSTISGGTLDLGNATTHFQYRKFH